MLSNSSVKKIRGLFSLKGNDAFSLIKETSKSNSLQHYTQNPKNNKKELQQKIIPLDEEQIMRVNCMNCQDLIQIENIEEHSKFCTTIPEIVENIESENILVQVVFKLKKLEKCLVDLLKNPDLRPGEINSISIFIRLCQRAVNNKGIEDVDGVIKCLSSLFTTYKGSLWVRVYEDVDGVIKCLSSLFTTYKGSLWVRVYADRLFALVQEQKLGYQEAEINTKKQELEKYKEQVSKIKKRQDSTLNLSLKSPTYRKSIDSDRKIEDVNSEIGSIYSGSSELTVLSMLEDESKHNFEEKFPNSSNDLQERFLSLCLTIKMQNSGTKNIKNLSIQKLYKESQRCNISPNDWSDFIIDQMKNPMKWLEDPRSRRRLQPRSFNLRPQCFEAIIEENHCY
ncbi:hypothetical protein SteCoe_26187 [Stentor coeruleus]|uniref:Uncharacterized protein n=1 Tax=Stentor coeruleus TaxID=5963 RepID=A0A1R2BDF2_9CILI|nr:hypothetical protein SteCoe_26187 [Stentor coeruleus]